MCGIFSCHSHRGLSWWNTTVWGTTIASLYVMEFTTRFPTVCKALYVPWLAGWVQSEGGARSLCVLHGGIGHHALHTYVFTGSCTFVCTQQNVRVRRNALSVTDSRICCQKEHWTGVELVSSFAATVVTPTVANHARRAAIVMQC